MKNTKILHTFNKILPLIFFSNFLCSKEFKTIDDLKSELKKINVVDFNMAMQVNFDKNKIIKNNLSEIEKRWAIYKSIYNKNNLQKITACIIPKTPKIIHQIWLGGRKFPQKYEKISRKWKDLHPDWQYILWTDKNIKGLFPLYNQKYFDLSKNFGEKSDILRYEILYRFGGIYVDVDYECVKPFDILAHCYNFFVGVEPQDTSELSVGNALIGSCANHPILKDCIENVKNNRYGKLIPKRTGPELLTKSFLKIAKNFDNSIIAFPATYFYPLGYSQRFLNLSQSTYVRPETFGIHYWAGKWR